MDRRTLLKSWLWGAVASSAGLKSAVAQSTPEIRELRVESKWITDGETDSGLDAFATKITAFESIEEATRKFDDLFGSIQEGTIYNEDTRNETFGDESFFVHYNNMGGLLLIYEGTILIDRLIYEFRWEAVHFGGARDGHRLFESVIERAHITEDYTETDLVALLPTEPEAAQYRLIEVEDITESTNV